MDRAFDWQGDQGGNKLIPVSITLCSSGTAKRNNTTKGGIQYNITIL